ncbi:hypothetical protein [Butyrivibrio sp. AC2005]|uniref:hypothetical protein n=1 Tax=Butyrivibrio sp. AC2005 TaxID=1280672 RepID=UPI00041D79CC|nr:hypothetical protein [Butyrivibrio sp. AC2005]
MMFPFDDPFDADIFNEDYNDDEDAIARRREIAGIMIEDMISKEQGNEVAPDTTGVDYFFLTDFITEDMGMDFAIIEQDFLDKCRGRLKEFNEVGWYGDVSFRLRSPLECMHNKMMMLIYNGAKLGDEYCVELLKYLYKTYHKDEYKSLKRFRTIRTEEIFGLAEDEFGGCDFTIIGRIMGMCPFMNIEFHENCSVLYKLLLKRRDAWIKDDEEVCEYLEFDHKLFLECAHQVDEWLDAPERKGLPFERLNKQYLEMRDFAGACLRNQGYADDYVEHCMENYMGIRVQMARTLAVLKTQHPNKEYTFEQVQRFTNVYDIVAALTDIAECVEYEIGYLTGDQVDPIDVEDSLFKPENVVVRNAQKKEVKKQIIHVAPVKKGNVSEDEYIKEIAELRSKLHEKEQENKYLREQYRVAKKSSEESEELISKYEEDRAELIALREYAYKSEHDEPVSEDAIPDMKSAIAEKNVVIIGGHVSWQNKLKALFPNWMFIAPDAYKTVDGKMLENKDMVYFYTDYINHISYKKFIAAVRERKIPFGYLGSNNVDNVVNQIYGDLG